MEHEIDDEQQGVRLPDRQARLEELAELIRRGEYHIPAEWVAESILRWRGRAGRRN